MTFWTTCVIYKIKLGLAIFVNYNYFITVRQSQELKYKEITGEKRRKMIQIIKEKNKERKHTESQPQHCQTGNCNNDGRKLKSTAKSTESKKKLNKSVLPPICILEDSTPSSSSKSLLRSSGSSPITVKFDFQQRKNVSKRRSTALRNARNENTRIKEELRKKSTLAAKWKKTFLRLKTKESEEVRKKPEAENRNIMTPY